VWLSLDRRVGVLNSPTQPPAAAALGGDGDGAKEKLFVMRSSVDARTTRFFIGSSVYPAG
jgi:hypothetical protein